MPDCIVVGGGVIGLLSARELHQRGMDVLVIERSGLGGESSWAGGGIISPLYPWLYHDSVNALAQASKPVYSALAEEMGQEGVPDFELIQSGLLVAGGEDIHQAKSWGEKWSESVTEVRSAEAMSAIEPALGPSFTEGIFMPDVRQLRNPKFVAALKASFEYRNIPFREHTAVEKILYDRDKVIGVRVQGEDIIADKVVIASGAWSARLIENDIDVEPVKGQMIMYRGEPGLIKRIVLSEGHYVIPRADGRVLAGSTLEKRGFDKSISEDAMQELHQAAVEIIPALDEVPVERQWSGLRPGTENGIPYICQHENIEGLFINAGHYRNGIVLGPASAMLLADLVCGATPKIDVLPYTMGAVH